ncbi:hypothetical protein ACTFIU_011209 [Dictyostelium citrinum]
MITLPIYLQKYIIKKLCIHINYYNSLTKSIGIFDDYRKDENEIKKLMITIALVSKEWFKTLSDNLTISVDFNYKEKGKDQYSIIKSDNIETLKLHFNHDDQKFYWVASGELIKIPIEIVNDKIMKLSTMEGTNFKYLKLRNVNHDFEIGVLDKLYQCKQTNDRSVSIREYSLSPYVNIEQINHLKKIVSKIDSLQIYETPNFEVFIETFKQWSNSLKSLIVPYSKRSYSIIDNLSSYKSSCSSNGSNSDSSSSSDNSSAKINFLSNLRHYQYSPISISELDTLIKSSPKLNFISIGICIRTYLYYLLNDQLQQQQQQKEEPKLSQFFSKRQCFCNSISFNESRDGNLITENEKSNNFNNHFSNLIKYLNENENTINRLQIYNYCSFHNQVSMCEQFLKIPTFLIEKLASFISSFKSLKVFEIYLFNEQLFNQIAIKNPNITHYIISIPHDVISSEDAIKYSTEILLKYPHIIEFKIRQI